MGCVAPGGGELHGVEPFMRSLQVLSQSCNSTYLIEHQGSLPHSDVAPPVPILSQINPFHASPSHLPLVLHRRISPRPCDFFRNIASFYGEELLAPRPTLKLESPLFGCLQLLIRYTSTYPPYLEAVTAFATRGRECCDDRKPLIMECIDLNLHVLNLSQDT